VRNSGLAGRGEPLVCAPGILAGIDAVETDQDLRTRVLASRPMKYMCESCGFIYDPEEGDPDGGIPPGTEFEDIPDTWFCPVCGARKADFTPYED
jgi:rubredoxin